MCEREGLTLQRAVGGVHRVNKGFCPGSHDWGVFIWLWFKEKSGGGRELRAGGERGRDRHLLGVYGGLTGTCVSHSGNTEELTMIV